MATETETPLHVIEKAQLLDSLANDPKYRGRLFGLIKELKPDAVIPEVDAPVAVMTTLKPHLEAIEQTKQEVAQERDAMRAERATERFQTKHQLSEEEMGEVRKVLTEEKVGSPDAAVELVRLRQAARPRTIPTRSFELPSVERIKELRKNPLKWAQDEAYKFFAERDAARVRR